ncbi:hypothetical protein Bca101_036271 [Brassica carinata]
MNNDTERLESEEVTRNKTGRDDCSRKAWLTEVKEVGVCLEMMFEADLMVKRQIIELPTKKSSSPPLSNDPYIVKADSSVMGCENRDVHIQLLVTVLATFWPVFELLSAVFEAESRAWINMYVISLKNTKGVRVTGSQTSDLLDDSLAMEFAIESLSIVTLQVVDIHIKGVVSVVGDCIWTLNFTSVWFHSPRPPDICLSEQYRSWGILSKERAIALNLVVLNREEPELLQEPEQLRVRWTAAEDGVEDDAAHSEAAVEAHHTGERIEQGHRTADSKLQGHMPVEAHTDRHIGYQAHSLGLMQCRK